MTTIIKITKGWKVSPYTGLTRKEGFDLENDCLTILNSDFKCLCDVKCSHFPKIISCNQNEYKFIFSNCGYSIDKYELLIKTNKIKPITIKNMEEQIECIIYNLKKCKIKHLDMCPSGKNLCINEKGILSIIDFDIATINNKYKLEKQTDIINADEKDIENAFETDSYYIDLKKQLTSIISRVF